LGQLGAYWAPISPNQKAQNSSLGASRAPWGRLKAPTTHRPRLLSIDVHDAFPVESLLD